MHARVTWGAQGDQVLLLVAARMAPELVVMHLQVLRGAASLASPAIARQHLAVQFAVTGPLESAARGLGSEKWIPAGSAGSCRPLRPRRGSPHRSSPGRSRGTRQTQASEPQFRRPAR